MTEPTTRHAPSGHQGGKLAAHLPDEDAALPVAHAPLTTQSWVTYGFATEQNRVTASAPAGLTDSNIREVFWRPDEQPTNDQSACITWDTTADSVEGQPIQPGLALRIASTGPQNQGLRAITLTENIAYAGTWLFNVHIWDTTQPQPMALLGTFDASGVVGRVSRIGGRTDDSMAQPPWHLCAQALGDLFRFKVWTGNDSEPDWNDPARVFSVTLPPGWAYVGYTGGYIGHLHPGQSATAVLPPRTAQN